METGLHLPEIVLRLASRCTPLLRLGQTGRVAVLLLLAGSGSTCLAVKPVTGEQLEQILSSTHNASDAQMAAQLSDLTLIERLNPAAVSRCVGGLPGPRSRQAFVVLTDMSEFLEPPAAEIPGLAKPDPEAQRRMIAMTVDYASKTIHQLPNFSAMRVTTTFQDNPSFDGAKTKDRRAIPDLMMVSTTLHPVGRYSAAVLYRKGREEVHAETEQSKTQVSIAASPPQCGVSPTAVFTSPPYASGWRSVWSTSRCRSWSARSCWIPATRRTSTVSAGPTSSRASSTPRSRRCGKPAKSFRPCP